ncbi:hypothetical protein J7E86_26635, partial [Streptomyces sp. ISL-11]|nr:hypothetical protein [Streptomyces sp. ISL-11]
MAAEPMGERELTDAVVRTLSPGVAEGRPLCGVVGAEGRNGSEGPEGAVDPVRTAARQALERLTGPARRENPALAAAWEAATDNSPERLADLAHELLRARGGALREAVRAWLHAYGPAGAARAEARGGPG